MFPSVEHGDFDSAPTGPGGSAPEKTLPDVVSELASGYVQAGTDKDISVLECPGGMFTGWDAQDFLAFAVAVGQQSTGVARLAGRWASRAAQLTVS